MDLMVLHLQKEYKEDVEKLMEQVLNVLEVSLTLKAETTLFKLF